MPLLSPRFEPIDPDERKPYSFDFSRYLDSGDTIASVAWEAHEWDEAAGEAGDSASAILDGSGAHTATVASHWIHDCTAGTLYRLTARATTASGAVLELAALMLCEGD